MTPAERLAKAHREYRSWPLVKGEDDPRRREDGYNHACRKCVEPWPCDVRLVLDELAKRPQMDPEVMTLAEAAAFLRLSPEGLEVLNAPRRDTLAATQRYSERE